MKVEVNINSPKGLTLSADSIKLGAISEYYETEVSNLIIEIINLKDSEEDSDASEEENDD